MQDVKPIPGRPGPDPRGVRPALLLLRLLACVMLVTPVVALPPRAGALGAVIARLTVTPATTGADVSWSVAHGAVVDGFRVDATLTGASVPERSATCDATTETLALRGLRSDGTYVVTVSALVHGAVADQASDVVRAGHAVAGVTATPVAGGLRVAWSVHPGAAVQGFRVTARDASSGHAARTVDTEERTHQVVVRGLRPRVRHTVTVHVLFADEPVDGVATTAVAGSGAPYWPGWDIARGVALAPGGGGYTLDAWGAVHPWADAEHPAPAAPGRLRYSRGRDVTRGLAVLPDGRAGLVLDGRGRIDAFVLGVGGSVPRVREAARSSTDSFRGIAVLPSGTGGYTVDGSGGLHPFAIDAAPRPPAARLVAGAPHTDDWARGLAITPDGRGGFVFDGFGHAYPFSVDSARAPRPPSRGPAWSFRIVRGASLLVGTGAVLDGFGGVHRFVTTG
ncbi:MAG TPA: fibronectin type III domain-containing protein [Acidimicrobiia bacterium]|jgi:hypothetical protein